MNKYIMITTTFEDKNEAENLIDVLLEKRLISCAQILNINSAYHWNRTIEKTNEYLIQMKSKKSLYKEIENVILRLHSYEIPQIVCFDIIDGYKDYLDWIDQETK